LYKTGSAGWFTGRIFISRGVDLKPETDSLFSDRADKTQTLKTINTISHSGKFRDGRQKLDPYGL